jgi:6-phosphogluconolactonase (cycloisomerase 2 family)
VMIILHGMRNLDHAETHRRQSMPSCHGHCIDPIQSLLLSLSLYYTRIILHNEHYYYCYTCH